MSDTKPCVFCNPSEIKSTIRFIRGRTTGVHCMVFEPLRPVTPGHELVVPVEHSTDASDAARLAAGAMEVAAEVMHLHPAANIITSKGAAATQTVMHTHLHVVPREPGDGLQLPWSAAPDGTRPPAPDGAVRVEPEERLALDVARPPVLAPGPMRIITTPAMSSGYLLMGSFDHGAHLYEPAPEPWWRRIVSRRRT